MSRKFDQIFLSKETDSFNLQSAGSDGTATVTKYATPPDQIFVTDILAQTQGGYSQVEIFDGTAYKMSLHFGIGNPLVYNFKTPIKIVSGTCNVSIQDAYSTSDLNISGYIKR